MPTLNPSHLTLALRFGGVAAVAAVIHLGLAELLVWSVVSLPTVAANLLAFVPAVMVNYLGQRHFTFGAPGSARRFMLLSLVGLSANTALLAGLSVLGVRPAVGLLLAAAGSPCLTFVGCRFFVFKAQPPVSCGRAIPKQPPA